jgi:hypothetical protein
LPIPCSWSRRHSWGPGSSIRSKPDHPVVHVAWADVAAYANWAGKQIPAEAEWELAARGGLDGAEFAWGDELTPGRRWMANTWQGEFPVSGTGEDGYRGTSPAGVYPANGYGLSGYREILGIGSWSRITGRSVRPAQDLADHLSGRLCGGRRCCRRPGWQSAQPDQAADCQVGAQEEGDGGHELHGVAQQPVLGVLEQRLGGLRPEF